MSVQTKKIIYELEDDEVKTQHKSSHTKNVPYL